MKVAASHLREQAASLAGCCRLSHSDILWDRCCRVGSGLFFWSQFAGFLAGCCCFLCNPVYSDFLLLLLTIWTHERRILEDRNPVFRSSTLSSLFKREVPLHPHSPPFQTSPLSESPPSGGPSPPSYSRPCLQSI